MPDFASAPALSSLAGREWDILVVGGGITGAGLLREAARLGLRVLLVEQNDFASGTSSRSSKLVHGGLHYLTRFQVGLARAAVREREQMLRAGAGLVERLNFLVPTLGGHRLPARLLGVALSAYDLLGGRLHYHPQHNRAWVQHSAPGLTAWAQSAFSFSDAGTDDARLVLRVLREGCGLGGQALNYVAVTELLRDEAGEVVGARLCDRETGLHASVQARVVVNATGPWADALRGQLDAPRRLRLLRGSHLILPRQRLALARALVCLHPESRQPLYCIPWEGVTLVGATSVDHAGSLGDEPHISPDEAGYLLRGVQALFPSLALRRSDIIATYAGVRPLVDNHATDPSKASREHAIWSERGLLTVTGGKLTTFRVMALEALAELRYRLPQLKGAHRRALILEALPPAPAGLPFAPAAAKRLLARYGAQSLETLAAASAAEQQVIPGLRTMWGEVRWISRMERVRHLDDLLLRRLRIGLVEPDGGLGRLEALRGTLQPELGWDDGRWRAEVGAYQEKWAWAHGVPQF